MSRALEFALFFRCKAVAVVSRQKSRREEAQRSLDALVAIEMA